MASYRIVDEPRPSRLSELSVNPFWIFLATMLGGAVFGWLWFLFNGHAFGSPTRRREALLVVGGALGIGAFLLAAGQMLNVGWITPASAPYLGLGLVALKITVAYFLHLAQSRGFELYLYFGGRERNGFLVLAALFLLRLQFASWLGPSWSAVLL